MNISLTKDKVWTLYKWAILLVMLESLKVWLFWGLPIKHIIPILFIPLTIIVSVLLPELFAFKKKSVVIISILYLMANFAATRGNINAYLGMLITSFSVIAFVGLQDNYKKEFLSFFINIFSVVIGISSLGWMIYLLGVNLPNFYDSYGFSETRNEAQYYFQNYYIFLKNIGTKYTDLSDLIIPRFSSVFLEPGYFSVLLVVLLYINGFNLKKKYNIVFLLALFLTFSLAGYLIGIFSYIAYKLIGRKNKIIVLFSIGLFLVAFYMVFTNYNNGDNAINEFIIKRLQYDDSIGTISGYNRTKESFEIWFVQTFLKSSDIFFGADMYESFIEQGNVGWKVYWASYGIVGLVLYILCLYYIYINNKNYLSFIFLFVYLLIFARGHHVIYYSAFPILYISGLAVLKDIKE